jgi:hypothetical protein
MARLSAPKRSSHSKNAAASFVRRHEIVCDTCRDQRAGANQESLAIVTARPWASRSRKAASVPYQVASARSALGAAFLRCGPCMLPRPSVSKETIKLALRGRDASASQPFLSKTSCATCALFRGREWRESSRSRRAAVQQANARSFNAFTQHRLGIPPDRFVGRANGHPERFENWDSVAQHPNNDVPLLTRDGNTKKYWQLDDRFHEPGCIRLDADGWNRKNLGGFLVLW